jgi:hypothetical protein
VQAVKAHKVWPLAGSILVALVLHDVARACSMSFPNLSVQRNFKVLVTHDGKPTDLVEVTISQLVEVNERFESKTVVSALTDNHGAADFTGLAVGEYFVVAKHAGVEGGAAELKVVAEASAKSEISLIWPNGPIIKLQNVAGVLGVGDMKVPLANAEIVLVEALSAQEVGKASTDQNGWFNIEGVKAGLYILRIAEPNADQKRPGTALKGNLRIEVDPRAENKELPTYGLIESGCGLAARGDANSMILFEI